MDHSPLGRLPGELRNKIYELVLFEPDGIVICHASVHDHTLTRASLKPNGTKLPHALLAGLPCVCKEIRNETSGIYFTINTKFTYLTYHYTQIKDVAQWFAPLIRWIYTIGVPQFASFRDVTLDLGTVSRSTPLIRNQQLDRIGNIKQLIHPAAVITIRTELEVFDEGRMKRHSLAFPLDNSKDAKDSISRQSRSFLRSLSPKAWQRLVGRGGHKWFARILVTLSNLLYGLECGD